MLQIEVPGGEFYDEDKEEIVYVKPVKLQLEHSLVSLSKWESKWEKPFLGEDNKTNEELIDYIRCMTLTQNVDPLVYLCLPEYVLNEINTYINSSRTATRITDLDKKSSNKEIVTSELIYYWMISLQIPVEFQKWHLNRLITLIKVCNIKNSPPKKMSKREIMNRNRALNAKRRAAMRSKG